MNTNGHEWTKSGLSSCPFVFIRGSSLSVRCHQFTPALPFPPANRSSGKELGGSRWPAVALGVVRAARIGLARRQRSARRAGRDGSAQDVEKGSLPLAVP